jgi:Fe2+ or Zn2+ uptake regulation protein
MIIPMSKAAIDSSSEDDSIGARIRTALSKHGQRRTRQKGQIAGRLAELATAGVDFTIEDLWQGLRQTDPHMGRATIFRAVETLANQGLLNRIDFADGSHTYRACGENHHHHLTCVQCHQVVDIEVCLPTEQFAIIGEKNNYMIEGHSLTLFGLCEHCQKEKAPEGEKLP